MQIMLIFWQKNILCLSRHLNYEMLYKRDLEVLFSYSFVVQEAYEICMPSNTFLVSLNLNCVLV